MVHCSPSFRYPQILRPGALTSLPITQSLTITFTTQIQDATERTIREAIYSPIVVSPTLAVSLFWSSLWWLYCSSSPHLSCAFKLMSNSAGYPIITFFTRTRPSRQGGFNIGGLNASGQVLIHLSSLSRIPLTLSIRYRKYPVIGVSST